MCRTWSEWKFWHEVATWGLFMNILQDCTQQQVLRFYESMVMESIRKRRMAEEDWGLWWSTEEDFLIRFAPKLYFTHASCTTEENCAIDNKLCIELGTWEVRRLKPSRAWLSKLYQSKLGWRSWLNLPNLKPGSHWWSKTGSKWSKHAQ